MRGKLLEHCTQLRRVTFAAAFLGANDTVLCFVGWLVGWSLRVQPGKPLMPFHPHGNIWNVPMEHRLEERASRLHLSPRAPVLALTFPFPSSTPSLSSS